MLRTEPSEDSQDARPISPTPIPPVVPGTPGIHVNPHAAVTALAQAAYTSRVTPCLPLRLEAITWVREPAVDALVTVRAATRPERGGLLTKPSSGLAHHQALDRVLLGDRTQLVDDGAVEVRA
jgi:hypothetical protein